MAVQSISSKHNLVTGRVSTVVPSLFTGSPLRCRLARVATVQLVFTLTVRTNPSRLGITSAILPSGHLPLGNDSSANKTKSPTSKFLLGVFHFFLSNKVGRYSFVHLRQNKLAKYWACFQARLQLRSSLSNIPGGKPGQGRRCNKWLGVSGCSSRGLSLLRVSGLEFRMFTASLRRNSREYFIRD